MTNSKQTKKALLSSVIALILCFSMLLGTTFAWFTDSVSSGLNEIKAGNLDIELYYGKGDPDKKVEIDTADLFTDADGKAVLWEPGAVAYTNLKVVNEGTLALTYLLEIAFQNENATKDNGDKLSQVLKVGVVPGGVTKTAREDVVKEVAAGDWMNLAAFQKLGNLAPEGENNDKAVYGIVIWWEPSDEDDRWNLNNGRETTDNENYLHIDLGVSLQATQLTYENDSFGNDYDVEANGRYNLNFMFNNPADLLAFAPTPGDAASSGLSITDDGKAQIDASGAWFAFDADLSENEYHVEYELDITDLAEGESLTVDTGEKVSWNSTPIMLERGSTKVYYGTSKNEYLGALEGTVVTVSHTYSYNAEGKLEIKTTVSDGVDAVTYTKAVASAPETTLYWDIYGITDAGNATLDTFSLKEADAVVDSAAELESVLAEGGLVVLTADIASENGFAITTDTQLDLNGHTLTATGDRAYLFTVEGDADLTITGGKLVAESTNHMLNGTGSSTGASTSVYFESTGNLSMTDVEIQASVRGGHRAIEVWNGCATLTNVDIVSHYGSGINAGEGAYVVLNDCDITVNGMYSAPYNSVCFSVMYGGEITINSGNYKLINDNVYATGNTHGGWVGIVMNSGGTITTNGGTYTNVPAEGFVPQYERAIIEAENLDPATATVNLLGGIFIPQNNKVVSGYGDVNYPVVNAYLIDNGDGSWTAVPEIEGVTLTAVSGYAHLYTDGINYYVYDAQGLISMNEFWKANRYGNNMWGRSYNIMADIDGTGYTWDMAYINVGSNDNKGFVFDGHSHTVSGLTINGALFGGTPNGGNKPNDPGYVKDITFDGVKVVGDHFVGVVWGNLYNELVVENVTVINSEIAGKCNTAALVGGTVIEDANADASVKFINCVVRNNVITGEGKNGQDPNGANAYVGRVYGNTTVTFENCVSDGNVITNNNGLVGGGIYGYSVWVNDGFTGIGTCDSFANWNGIKVAAEGTSIDAALNSGASEVIMPDGNYSMPGTSGDVTISGTEDTVITVSGTPSGSNVTFNGVTVKGSGYSTGVNADFVTYNNATIVGDMCLYREKVVFNNCTFELNGQYIWTYAAKVVEFNNCTFNTTGKAILIYNEGAADTKVTVKNCTFNATAGAKAGAISNLNCAAIELDNHTGRAFELITEGNTYSEFFSGEWRIKSYASGNPITVNGVEYTKTALDGKLMTVTSTVATFD